MKNAFKMCIVALTMSATLANAQISTLGEAINKAGAQRMYTMKMAKNYMSIGAGIKVPEATKELEEVSTQFNENYNDLMLFAKTKETKDALTFAGTIWNKYREKVNETPTIENANAIITEANYLINACNVVVEKLVASSSSKTANLPNLCGKQRVLSQKLGMLYLAKFWVVSYPSLSKDMNETLMNFETSLTSLINAPENTDEINTLLKLQQSEWNFTKKSFDIDAEKMSPTSVYSSTNLMTRNFDRGVTMYQKLIN